MVAKKNGWHCVLHLGSGFEQRFFVSMSNILLPHVLSVFRFVFRRLTTESDKNKGIDVNERYKRRFPGKEGNDKYAVNKRRKDNGAELPSPFAIVRRRAKGQGRDAVFSQGLCVSWR